MCKAVQGFKNRTLSIYLSRRDSDNAPKEKYLKLLEFRHFERHILFSQSERKDKKKAISSGVNVQVVVRV